MRAGRTSEPDRRDGSRGATRLWRAGLTGTAVLALVAAGAWVEAPSGAQGAGDAVGTPATVRADGSRAPALEGARATDLLRRARAARTGWTRLAGDLDATVAPIDRVLLRYRDDPDLTARVAVSLVREARAVGLEPRLLLAVLLVENPWIDPSARSPVGAVGLMQVMPFHRGAWPACVPDLEQVEANICHGARIFAHYLRTSRGDPEAALLRYNGCVRGTNTPDCHRYPYHVFARAGRASILAWLPRPGAMTGAAAP